MPPSAPRFRDVLEAAARLDGLTHHTPVLTCGTLDDMAGRRLFFKCEHLQRVGAFKFRGACNAIRKMVDAGSPPASVVTHSSGNHAQAVALAARIHGIAAHIVMPENTSRPKLEAVRGYGARVVLCAPTLPARESTAAEVLAETGGTVIPPYDHADVIAGQGTAALELLEQVPDLDAVMTPVGGGGLISGTCLAVAGRRPGARVFGAEPLGADDAARSKAAGTLVPQTDPRTIADGLRTSLGQLTWPFVRDAVADVIPVEDDEIVRAMRLLWERAKLLVETNSATVLAAVLTERFRKVEGVERIGLILSGGNVDLDRLPW